EICSINVRLEISEWTKHTAHLLVWSVGRHSLCAPHLPRAAQSGTCAARVSIVDRSLMHIRTLLSGAPNSKPPGDRGVSTPGLPRPALYDRCAFGPGSRRASAIRRSKGWRRRSLLAQRHDGERDLNALPQVGAARVHRGVPDHAEVAAVDRGVGSK